MDDTRRRVAGRLSLLALAVLVLYGSAAAGQECGGDCDDDGQVTINELVTGVTLALQGPSLAVAGLDTPQSVCPAMDTNGDNQIRIDELVRAINYALTDCPLPTEAVGFCGTQTPQVEARVNTLLQAMTLDEKILQMHGVQLATIRGVFHTYGIERLGIPGFRMVDGPRGVRSGNSTAFPVGMARGATWDPTIEERVGEAIGMETRAKGGSVILAPCINLLRHPRWGRAQETYGEDPLHIGSMGVAFINGAQRHVIASAKHFALNSIENTRFTVNVTVDERTLREIYLPHFRMAVEQGHVGSVMTAYNQVNGHYAAENFHLVREILKGEWGFKGFVESDWIVGTRSTTPSALAGLDIEMPTANFYGPPLRAAVDAGAVPVRLINDAVRRILRTQLCFRLDSDPPLFDPTMVETPAHTALAREAEQKAIVLLRNVNDALPIDRSTIGSLAVVGPLSDVANLGDRGSSNVLPSYTITPLEGLSEHGGPISISHFPSNPLAEQDRAAIAAADAAVVVVGLTFEDEGEAAGDLGDRTMLGLPRGQDDLVAEVAALNPRTIVVVEGGSAITMPWINDVAAVLMAWYPGLEGGNAIADVIYGDVNPSGRLPISFAQSADDLPPFINDSNEVTYDYYHGYRYLDRNETEPLFPFGFGLSYTTFAYANLSLSAESIASDGVLTASFDVSNAGTRAGEEVVQLYVSYQGSSVDRPVRDLKRFLKVPLAVGETKRISFPVRAADLAYYDVDAAAWRVEPITYGVHIGSSSRDLPLEASFSVSEMEGGAPSPPGAG